ncbi:hypothetical protein AAG906_016113 [Vitis piasezkii]
MANFIAKLPQKPSHLTGSYEEGWWMLHVDGASRVSGSRVGLAIRLGFPTFNNEAEYELILA